MISLASHISARLQRDRCDGRLAECYAEQCVLTGTATTPEDALAAWQKWLATQGGWSESPLRVSDWKNGFHERVAAVIREVARYSSAVATDLA
jgi:hypothetical protein